MSPMPQKGYIATLIFISVVLVIIVVTSFGIPSPASPEPITIQPEPATVALAAQHPGLPLAPARL